jgi:hypothetical protein
MMAFTGYEGGRNRRFGFANDFNTIAISRARGAILRGFPFYGVFAEF